MPQCIAEKLHVSKTTLSRWAEEHEQWPSNGASTTQEALSSCVRMVVPRCTRDEMLHRAQDALLKTGYASPFGRVLRLQGYPEAKSSGAGWLMRFRTERARTGECMEMAKASRSVENLPVAS